MKEARGSRKTLGWTSEQEGNECWGRVRGELLFSVPSLSLPLSQFLRFLQFEEAFLFLPLLKVWVNYF